VAEVVKHVVAALAAVVLQVVADRLRGPPVALVSGSVLMIVAGVLWFSWWA
jgi:hypothetical protein